MSSLSDDLGRLRSYLIQTKSRVLTDDDRRRALAIVDGIVGEMEQRDERIAALESRLTTPDLFSQPGGARHSDPETSQRAAAKPSNVLRWGSQRRKLLETYLWAAAVGLTDERAGSISEVGSTAHKRVSELLQAGLIEIVPNAEGVSSAGEAVRVCRITDEGRAALRGAQRQEAEQA